MPWTSFFESRAGDRLAPGLWVGDEIPGEANATCWTDIGMLVPEAGELLVLLVTFLIFLIKYPAGSTLTGWGDGSVSKPSATQT